MAGFLLVSHGATEASTESSRRIRDRAVAEGLSPIDLSRTTWLALSGPRPQRIVVAGTWHLIGEVHDRRSASAGHVPDDDPHSYEKKLMARFWGGFVGVSFDSKGVLAAILRDPSGAMDCALWREDDLTLAGSDFPDWLIALIKPSWTINDARLHDVLIDPLLALGDLLLDGPISIGPGMLHLLPDGPPVSLWRPDWLARRGARRPIDIGAAASSLAAAVDEVTAGFARSGPVACEVSGGLDSAIVAASLVRQGITPPLWLSAYGSGASDERPFVMSLANHLSISITPVARRTGVIDAPFLQAMPHRLRPGLSALDGLHDADWADRLEASGIRAVLTGKGGDGLFVQPATGRVYADIWRAQGWRALSSPSLPALARWTERSVWSLIAEARGTPPPAGPGRVSMIVDHGRRPVPTSDWGSDIDDLGPAKQAQIAATVYGVGLHGPSLQTAVADVLHPLLQTPVVEACLHLPIEQLTLGRRDRALARLAFADRLPAEIVERRSKGEMSAFYGRMIAGGLDVLRPWLLEGRLASRGLIDRGIAERLLTPESLIWRGGYAEIMTVVAIEGWVRTWEARLATAS